jgi:hypothetical protein
VPHWDPAFALTEGREPINPRPRDQALIYQHFRSLHVGFITYSEGVNDDVNKFLWTGWGWRHEWPANAAHPLAQSILEDYSRLFIGPRWTQTFTQGLFDLENNWRGPLEGNSSIDKTLTEIRQIESSPDSPRDNWRLELALYRAYYDAFLQARKRQEELQQQEAYRALVAICPAEQKMKRAEDALTLTDDPAIATLHADIFELGRQSCSITSAFSSARSYTAHPTGSVAPTSTASTSRSMIESGSSKNSHGFAVLASEREKTAAIQAISSWRMPAVGSFYDDLGSPTGEPHLSPGRSYSSDPELYHAAIDGVADRTPEDGWRWSQLTYAETLYESPLTLDYSGLNPNKRYRLRVTYAGEDYSLPMRLVANHSIEIHGPRQRKSNPECIEFDIPIVCHAHGAIASGMDTPIEAWRFRPRQSGG